MGLSVLFVPFLFCSLSANQVTCESLPTAVPTAAPTETPTLLPTISSAPTVSAPPTEVPVLAPTPLPSEAPTSAPTTVPARSNCACFSGKMVENLQRFCPKVSRHIVEGCMPNVTRAVLETLSSNCTALKADWGPYFGSPIPGYPKYG